MFGKSICFGVAALALLSMPTAFAREEKGKQDTYKRIAAVRVFTVGHIGRGSTISSTEKDLWVFLRAKDEISLLSLTREKNPVSQLYGLLGLRYLNHFSYKLAAKSLSKAQGKVETISGCCGESKSISAIATEISKGTYNAWLKRDMEQKQ